VKFAKSSRRDTGMPLAMLFLRPLSLRAGFGWGFAFALNQQKNFCTKKFMTAFLIFGKNVIIRLFGF